VVAFGQDNQQAKATDEVQTGTQTQVWRGPFFVDDNNNGIATTLKTEHAGDVARGEMPGKVLRNADNDGHLR